jgi:hypothetical protein
MARSRNIKPGFFTNDVLGELPPLTRLLFAGIWTISDREGRLEDRPKKIRAEVLPYDLCDADDMLQSLHDAGFIKRYQAAGKSVIQVLAWAEHQNPHMKEAASTLPAPDEHQTSTVQAPVEEQPSPEQAGLIPSSLIPDSLISDSKEKKARAPRPPAPAPVLDGVSAELLADYLVVRKAKNAGALTKTAIAGLQREADKAGISLSDAVQACCEYGWQGFNASWYAERTGGKGGHAATSETAYQRSMRERMQQFAPGVAAKAPGFNNVIELEAHDVTARRLG